MRTALLVVMWLMSATAVGHADIDERLAAVDAQIAMQPESRAFHIKRGELHRLHQDWPAALADYERAREIGAGSNPDFLDFLQGRMWWEAGEPHLALPLLTAFIDEHATHVDARINRARVFAALGDATSAAADLDVAIAAQQPPSPDLYLERARLLVEHGNNREAIALEGLDEGLDRLGPLVSLVQFGIRIQIDRGLYEDALARIDTLPGTLRQQPVWLNVRGEILFLNGEVDAARAVYAQAIAKLQALPESRRSSRYMIRLERELTQKMQRSDAQGGTRVPERHHSE